MAAIHDLLNPVPNEDNVSDQPSTKPVELKIGTHTSLPPAQLPFRTKQKLCKDAAIFVRGTVRGECRYPPDETQDDMLGAQHELFQIYPMGEIAEYPRHIPYSSDKKTFWEKTGRESLEVFQYQFKVPGDETTYTMLWDYNIGLVRTTPLFKCVGYSKTTPAKMLNRNAGLRDICHSITGGALVAQGYWMPWEAARAVAATFCYNIRYALTPVFGTDFPTICVPPESVMYGGMLIDSAITKRCAEQAQKYKMLEEPTSSRGSSTIPSPQTPVTPTFVRQLKKIRPKACKISSDSIDYSSDEGPADDYILSPELSQSSFRPIWTAANTPRSTPNIQKLQSALSVAIERPLKKLKRLRVDSDSGSDMSDGMIRKRPTLLKNADLKYDSGDADADDDDDDSEDEDDLGLRGAGGEARMMSSDEKAAYLLMGLRIQRAEEDAKPSVLKRRAST